VLGHDAERDVPFKASGEGENGPFVEDKFAFGLWRTFSVPQYDGFTLASFVIELEKVGLKDVVYV